MVPETRVFQAAEMVKFGHSSLHRFWLIHLCDGRTDSQTDERTNRQNCDGYDALKQHLLSRIKNLRQG